MTKPSKHAIEAAEKITYDFYEGSGIEVSDMQELIQQAIDAATAEMREDNEQYRSCLQRIVVWADNPDCTMMEPCPELQDIRRTAMNCLRKDDNEKD